MRRWRRKQSSAFPIEIPLLLAAAVIGVGSFLSIQTQDVYLLGVVVVLLALVVLGFITFLIIRQQRQELAKQKALRLSDIDHMSGVEFEQYVGKLLAFQGFSHIQFTKTSGDFGIDIIATKKGQKYGIQVKRYKDTVGRAAISDVVAALSYYQLARALVVTNSHFTPSAKELAASNKCELVDRETLAEWIVAFQNN